ncbi:YggS family pyridoxal phosphate-dependent enzyme [uncultured Litoreibacter sp.]|uniref:YggS family pyridoxal phosphate-dependent enzyme n=1 Tax=uncultured Litoreibacter sp. TaxID=1392394 RepID=UPI00260D713A|nr:YggS family pyridoxal phosphate-dependent enzyme [uncultured Litoreibacter sp.]
MPLADIQNRIAAETLRSGRPEHSTRLIAVSKVQPNERVEEVLKQGHRVFGENRVQEAAAKWPDFRKAYDEVELHLLGPLQTNKLRQAMELFDYVHTLDRMKLAKRFAVLKEELGHCPKLFIQVNTGNEPQKAGISIEDTSTFVADCRALSLPVIGLMCIPPVEDDPEQHFAMLRDLAKDNDLPELSMGMSSDFELAIAQGATFVRVGSAIFGDRVPLKA